MNVIGTFCCRARRTAFLLAATYGCAGEAPAAGALTSRDSAGIAIVESGAALWNLIEGWSLSPEPVLEIGVADGLETHQFHRVTSAIRLPGRRIAVADGGSREIRLFAADDGSHLRTFGGQGEGPGEFRGIAFIVLIAGDSLLVWDPALDRGTIFDLDGNLGRVFRPPDLGAEYVTLTDALSDGSLVGLVDQGIGRETPGGLVEATMTMVRITTSRADTLGRVPVGLSYISVSDGWVLMDVPFSPRGVYDAEDETLFYAYGDRCEVRLFTLSGEPNRIRRYPCARDPIASEDLDEFVELTTSRIEDLGERRQVVARIAEMPVQSRFPAFAELVADENGNAWLGAHLVGAGGDREWTVIDRSGQLLGSLRLPGDLMIHEIGEDYVLGVARDDLDIERVVMYNIVKP